MWIGRTRPWIDWAREHLPDIGMSLDLWLICKLDFGQSDTGLCGIWWPAPRTTRNDQRLVYGLEARNGLIRVHCTGRGLNATTATVEQAINDARHGRHVPLLSIWAAVRDAAALHPQYLDQYNEARRQLEQLRDQLPTARHVDILLGQSTAPPDPVLLRD